MPIRLPRRRRLRQFLPSVDLWANLAATAFECAAALLIVVTVVTLVERLDINAHALPALVSPDVLPLFAP